MRSNSVSTSLISACNSTMYYYTPGNLFPLLSQLVNQPLPLESSLFPPLRVCLQVCLIYGCRIGELLQSTTKDIIGEDVLLIHAEKGSRDYILYLPKLSSCFSSCLTSGSIQRIFPFTYIQVYRNARKVGLAKYLPGAKNAKVTHYGRYQLAQSIARIDSRKAASDALRHRSPETISYYLQRESD